MRLGVLQTIEDVGGRVIARVKIDGESWPDVQLVQPLGFRQHAVTGARVLLLELDGDDTQLFALPIEIPALASVSDTERIEARRTQGNAEALATKADAEALNDRIAALEKVFNLHSHTGHGATPTTPAKTSATITSGASLRSRRK